MALTNLHLPDDRGFNSLEELYITRVGAVNSFARVLTNWFGLIRWNPYYFEVFLIVSFKLSNISFDVTNLKGINDVSKRAIYG